MQTRADLVVNLTYLATLLAPLVSLVSYGLARRRRYAAHRRVQLVLLGVCVLAVLALELHIRLAGGSGALLQRGSAEWAGAARALLLVHIGAAVLTYILWGTLAVLSIRRFRATLPGAFSRRHRQLGWLVFCGLCFTTASATGMYLFAFVL